jgi:nucleoid-associated protein YgaU
MRSTRTRDAHVAYFSFILLFILVFFSSSNGHAMPNCTSQQTLDWLDKRIAEDATPHIGSSVNESSEWREGISTAIEDALRQAVSEFGPIPMEDVTVDLGPLASDTTIPDLAAIEPRVRYQYPIREFVTPSIDLFACQIEGESNAGFYARVLVDDATRHRVRAVIDRRMMRVEILALIQNSGVKFQHDLTDTAQDDELFQSFVAEIPAEDEGGVRPAWLGPQTSLLAEAMTVMAEQEGAVLSVYSKRNTLYIYPADKLPLIADYMKGISGFKDRPLSIKHKSSTSPMTIVFRTPNFRKNSLRLVFDAHEALSEKRICTALELIRSLAEYSETDDARRISGALLETSESMKESIESSLRDISVNKQKQSNSGPFALLDHLVPLYHSSGEHSCIAGINHTIGKLKIIAKSLSDNPPVLKIMPSYDKDLGRIVFTASYANHRGQTAGGAVVAVRSEARIEAAQGNRASRVGDSAWREHESDSGFELYRGTGKDGVELTLELSPGRATSIEVRAPLAYQSILLDVSKKSGVQLSPSLLNLWNEPIIIPNVAQAASNNTAHISKTMQRAHRSGKSSTLYTVKDDEWLSGISRRILKDTNTDYGDWTSEYRRKRIYGAVDEITRINEMIEDKDLIYAGDDIRIPEEAYQ